MTLERGPLLDDPTLRGSDWCRAHTDLVDAWLQGLFDDATGADREGLALVAVGGYGRHELCPYSDIDVMLVHRGQGDVAGVAQRLWYPIWDEGAHLGHSVCTVKEALRLASNDLPTATALLSARHVAGDPALTAQLANAATSQWQKNTRRWLAELEQSVRLRHSTAGEIAFLLEPDLKEGRGGLRDVHALGWAEAADRTLLLHDAAGLTTAYATLLAARVELQRGTARPTNVLVLQEQAGVAGALGDPDPDALMARLAEAARSIAWMSDDAWRRVRSNLRPPLQRISQRLRSLSPGIVWRDGEVRLDDQPSVTHEPTIILGAALAAARHNTVIERSSLERLAAEARPLPNPWPPEARATLVDLLMTGRAAIPVIEALDQRRVWERVLPEWLPVRARPQHNAYHRFTVDRHLLETAAQAAELVVRTERPDLLVMAALLHDLGKSQPGDHTPAGMTLAHDIATRMGYSADDVAVLVSLVQHHLLLAETAVRRDLDDPVTIARVASAVGSHRVLHLLSALTEADSLATGPSAWGPWKASLVTELVERVDGALGGEEIGDRFVEPFPREILDRLAGEGLHIDGQGDRLTVICDDRPGIFSRVAGVLALHGLDVLHAVAYSSEDRRAMSEFRVTDPFRRATPWPRIVADLELVLNGRLALPARLAERARTYGRSRPARSRHSVAAVAFDNAASAVATVIDVHAHDGVGVLYRMTRALAELDLDIRSARVQTLGSQVIDSFYVRDSRGAKVTDSHTLGEIERAILHSLGE